MPPRAAIVTALLLLASAAIAAALPQGASPPAPTAPQAPSPATPPAPAIAKVAREQRLAAEKAALEAEIAKVDAFGRLDEFVAALRALEAKHPADEHPDGKERWEQVSRGWIPMMAVDHFLEWHLPAEGGAQPVAVDTTPPHHPFHAIVDLSEQLRAHGVEFLLVIFPSRIQLYPELVVPPIGTPDPATFRGFVGATERFLLALNAKGVETVNLAPAFLAALHDGGSTENGEIYLQRNKHWTPRAVQLAAKVVADRIRAMEWFEEGKLREGRDFEILRRSASFGSNAGGQAPDVTAEKLVLETLRPVGAPPNPGDARRSPIVVLGDSFAKFYVDHSAAFTDQLKRFTGWPIDAIVPMGGAERQCREQLARRGDKLRGKKVVVWLMQEDNLRVSGDYRTVDLFAEPKQAAPLPKEGDDAKPEGGAPASKGG